MEEREQQIEDSSSVFDVAISGSVVYSLNETCKWARIFASIVTGFTAICLIWSFFEWSLVERLFYAGGFGEAGIIIAVFLLIILSVTGLFLFLLFNFSGKVKKGLAENNVQKVEQGIVSLRLYFIISGILSALYVLLLLIGLLALLSK